MENAGMNAERKQTGGGRALVDRIAAWPILGTYGLDFLTGVLLFVAVALLLFPEIADVKATWATFYGDF